MELESVGTVLYNVNKEGAEYTEENKEKKRKTMNTVPRA